MIRIVLGHIIILAGLIAPGFSFAAVEKNDPRNYKREVTYDPMSQARIRLYGQNGKDIYIRHSFDCKERKQGIRENVSSTGGWAAFKAYTRLTFNASVGMPETAIQTYVRNHFGTYELVSYEEYVVDANRPINLHGFILGAMDSARTKPMIIEQCSEATGSFKPLAGHSYEILGSDENGQCRFKLYDIEHAHASTAALSVEQPFVCPEKRKWFFRD